MINNNLELKNIIEGLLFASDEPLNINDLIAVLKAGGLEIEPAALKDAMATLVQGYAGHSLELKEVATGYRFQVKQEYAGWLGKLWEEKPPRYTRALLETLAIIAYKQPVTRPEIEDIRGVSVSTNIIKTLMDYEWVKIIDYKEVPGRPALYGTTNKFLDYFNIKDLTELPKMEAVNNGQLLIDPTSSSAT